MGDEGLLAKSARSGRAAPTLFDHLIDTERSALCVFKLGTRLQENYCRFFSISDPKRFLKHLQVASLFHDVGKANSDFQRAIRKPGFERQLYRHEHISGVILHLPNVRAWLMPAELDLESIVAAILGHHLKVSRNGAFPWMQPSSEKTSVPHMLADKQVRHVMLRIADLLGLGTPPSLPDAHVSNSDVWAEAKDHGDESAYEFDKSIRKDAQRRRFTAALKAGLIAADAVSSALVREGHTIELWIDENAHIETLTSAKLEGDILKPRRSNVEARTGRAFAYHRFQDLAAKQGPRSLLLAGCGAGKSMAAWRWAQAQTRVRDFSRVVFLYPTRGTATEGFRDYVGWGPETEVALLHASARSELDGIAENPEEPLAGKALGTSERDARLFALAFWRRRYFSATVDQFLGFIENRYASLCLLPALADSAIIIDEVHAFDRHLFDRLVTFLETFDVPVLCMTATLTCSRRCELEKRGKLVSFPTMQDREELADLELEENHPRYELVSVPDEATAFAKAVESFTCGKRVLWVVNTVNRCQLIATRLAELESIVALVYHSRFRLKDRKVAHGKTVAAFQQCQQPAFAVTTQVCEMSLDLDADVLLTELAPVSSLVQRFGRANRHRLGKPEGFTGTIITYQASSAKPYEDSDIVAARDFLASLPPIVSQRALADCLAKHAPPERSGDGFTSFLNGGYWSEPGSLREEDEHGSSPSILEQDLRHVLLALAEKVPIDEYILPLPTPILLCSKKIRAEPSTLSPRRSG